MIYDEHTTNFNLNNIRLKNFEQNEIKSLKSENVQKLSPTTSAAKYHSYKVVYQVQLWLGNETFSVTSWDWELIKNNFYPRRMDTPPPPQDLMEIIKCGCTLNCDSFRCNCKIQGILCTELCNNCVSGNCINAVDLNLLE